MAVRFEDALTFATWLTKRVGLQKEHIFDLPTEAEWEYVARGSDGRKYPWGNDAPNYERALFNQPWETGAPAPIGGRPRGKSPFGCQDMAGNVWEWCLDAWRDGYGNYTALGQTMTNFVNPCQPGERSAPRVVRGGSWHGAGSLRCTSRDWLGPDYQYRNLGFRLVCRGSRKSWLIGS